MEKMSGYKNQIFHENNHQHTWGFIEKSNHECIEEETSTISNGSTSSCSSLDTTTDDASSSSSTGSSLLDLSDLMSHLPIKRGLSKFYHGKSESFTSLARVMSIEDLPKKPYNIKIRKMKPNYKSYTLPKPIISKNKTSPFLKQRSFARSTLHVPGQQDKN